MSVARLALAYPSDRRKLVYLPSWEVAAARAHDSPRLGHTRVAAMSSSATTPQSPRDDGKHQQGNARLVASFHKEKRPQELIPEGRFTSASRSRRLGTKPLKPRFLN